jgi:hypothetical protein
MITLIEKAQGNEKEKIPIFSSRSRLQYYLEVGYFQVFSSKFELVDGDLERLV